MQTFSSFLLLSHSDFFVHATENDFSLVANESVGKRVSELKMTEKKYLLGKIIPWKEHDWLAKKTPQNPRRLEVLSRFKIGEEIARIEFEEKRNTPIEEILECLPLPRMFHEKIRLSIKMFNDVIRLMEWYPDELFLHSNITFE
jgi:hypothetical protein